MKIKRTVITAAFVATSAFATSTIAGEASERFTQLDANGDGAISLEEAAGDPKIANDWATIDANQDGRVESAEFSAYEEKAPSK